MKLSTAFLFVASMASTAAKTLKGEAAAKVLRAARRVEENGQDAQEEDEYAYLTKYSLKMVSCASDLMYTNPENGEYEYGSVVVRLCPAEDGCDSESVAGCGAGYGDFVVGINTFVDAYFEDQRDNMQWDDMFQVDRYAECAEYEPEAAEDDQAANWENYQFFIGPTCTEEGDDIKLGFFSEYTCTTESEIEFETVSNGWNLPYTSGGLVSTYCMDCLEYNDNGEYVLRDMCMNTYMSASYKCEENMEYFSYYGQNVQGCESIAEMLPKTSGGSGGKVFGWIVFILLVGGMAAYIVWWRKKKSDIVA